MMSGDESVPINFGDKNLTLQPHSIKLSIEVVNWPFQSIRNLLRLSLSIDAGVIIL